MKTIARRVAAVAAFAVVAAAGGLVVPTVASAAAVLAAPEVIGTAYYGTDSASFEVDWDAVGATGDPSVTVAGFEIKLLTSPSFSDTDLVAHATSSSTAAGSVLFNGLTVGRQYQGAVRTIYDVSGGGPTPIASDWATTTVEAALKPAPKPLSVSARASAVGTITVAWRAPSIPADTEGVLGYGIDASPRASASDVFDTNVQYESTSKTVDAGQTSTRLTGLRPGVTYDVDVYTLGDGSGFTFGGGSATTSVKVLGAPAAPTKLTVKTLKAHKSKLSWKGAKVTSAGPVTGYRVYVNGKLKKTLGASGRSYTATGQKKGKTYKYTVKAYNTVASSSAASISKRRTS